MIDEPIVVINQMRKQAIDVAKNIRLGDPIIELLDANYCLIVAIMMKNTYDTKAIEKRIENINTSDIENVLDARNSQQLDQSLNRIASQYNYFLHDNKNLGFDALKIRRAIRFYDDQQIQLDKIMTRHWIKTGYDRITSNSNRFYHPEFVSSICRLHLCCINRLNGNKKQFYTNLNQFYKPLSKAIQGQSIGLQSLQTIDINQVNQEHIERFRLEQLDKYIALHKKAVSDQDYDLIKRSASKTLSLSHITEKDSVLSKLNQHYQHNARPTTNRNVFVQQHA